LEIKKANVSSEKIKKNIITELKVLNRLVSEEILRDPDLMMLWAELKVINQKIWDIEDEIRSKETIFDFSQRFIELARNTYKFNDKRAAIKREINNALNSAITEEKVY
jgi:hypothetical protein